MRRFVLLQFSPEEGAQRGVSSFWKGLCGEKGDVWEVFQLKGAEGILLVGSKITDLPETVVEEVVRLLSQVISDRRLPLLATGSTASLVNRAVDYKGDKGIRQSSAPCTCLPEDVHATAGLMEWPWAGQLEEMLYIHEEPPTEHERRHFHLCNVEAEVPEMMRVLITAQTDGSRVTETDVPVAWGMAPYVLVLNIDPAEACTDWPNQRCQSACTIQDNIPPQALAFMAQLFIKGPGTPQETDRDSDLRKHATSSTGCSQDPQAGASLLASPEVRTPVPHCTATQRPDFEQRSTAVQDTSKNLLSLLRRSLSVEVNRQTLEIDLNKDIHSTAHDHYNSLECQVKGMLAFLHGLQVKKQQLEPTLHQVELFEKKLDRLEVLVNKLELSARDLESMCCECAGLPGE